MVRKPETPPTAMADQGRHRPVMLAEVLAALEPRDGGLYVDATFGAGGYSIALLDAARCKVMAFDRDPGVAPHAQRLKNLFGERFEFFEARFSQMEEVLNAQNIKGVDGIALDIGVSSMHLDEAARGFSFAKDGPLDMSMSHTTPNASDVVNGTDEAKLAQIIRLFGEERHARRIARAIIERRQTTPILRTLDLAAIIEQAVPSKAHERIHPATKTFQALRIYVNNELEELWCALMAAERLLRPAGRLAVVVFHSLEDRIVKQFFRERAEPKSAPSRHIPFTERNDADRLTFKYLAKRMQTPSPKEVADNPRARSAKLRAAERTSAQAWTHTAIDLWWREVA